MKEPSKLSSSLCIQPHPPLLTGHQRSGSGGLRGRVDRITPTPFAHLMDSFKALHRRLVVDRRAGLAVGPCLGFSFWPSHCAALYRWPNRSPLSAVTCRQRWRHHYRNTGRQRTMGEGRRVSTRRLRHTRNGQARANAAAGNREGSSRCGSAIAILRKGSLDLTEVKCSCSEASSRRQMQLRPRCGAWPFRVCRSLRVDTRRPSPIVSCRPVLR